MKISPKFSIRNSSTGSRAGAVLTLLLLAFSTQAANPPDVLINEIAWMGTEISYSNEWIELYNNTASPVNLDGWTLKTTNGTPEIKLSGTILANSYYLLERTADATIPDIPADQIYTGALENNGESLELYDDSKNLIDSVNCSNGWLTGDNKTKQTMERIDSGSWQTSKNPGGTPKTQNSYVEGSPQPMVEGCPQPIYGGVVINEILPSPEGADAENEWIEIFNQNSFGVDLSGWQITDTVGTTKTYSFPKETKVSSKGFLIFSRPTTKITLNNSGDSLKLIQPDGNILDSVNYEKAPKGESFNRTDSGWQWSPTLTPGNTNIILPVQVAKTDSEEKPGLNPQETKKKEGELATISKQFPEDTSFSFFVPLIALTLAVLSAMIVLSLKKQIKSLK